MAMTVRELIAALQQFPPDTPVVKSKNAEGNGFEDVQVAQLGRFANGEFYIYELTDRLRAQGYSEEDVDPEAPPAICLW